MRKRHGLIISSKKCRFYEHAYNPLTQSCCGCCAENKYYRHDIIEINTRLGFLYANHCAQPYRRPRSISLGERRIITQRRNKVGVRKYFSRSPTITRREVRILCSRTRSPVINTDTRLVGESVYDLNTKLNETSVDKFTIT